MRRKRTDVLGVSFDDVTMDEAVLAATTVIKSRRARYVVTPNPEIVWLCRKDTALKSAIDDAFLVLADGVGVSLGAKILGRPLKARVPGMDFAEALMARMSGTVFLLGAKPGVAERAAAEIERRHGGVKVVGVCDGYFTDDTEIIERISALSPDLLLVCLGAPKQELWMQRQTGRLSAGLMLGLGGVLDVLAGDVERAPEKWRKLGLEWLYRLLKQPSRIKRMIKLPAFLLAVIWARLRGK